MRPVIELGRAVRGDALAPEEVVSLSPAMANRHGLIAGATGTGKSRTLQLLAERLSSAGVPCVVADVKGDMSGLAAPGDPGGKAAARAQELGQAWTPRGFPVEFLSLGGIGPGTPVRATVSDFGPQLLAKVLRSNRTQEESLALVFHYADARGLPLLDLADLRALLSFLGSPAGKAELEGIGGLAKPTVGVLLRALVGLETGGGTELFGEPQFEIADLMRVAPDGRGVISCVELAPVQDKPGLWSTALLWLLAELFEELPEAGDLPQPKLVFFFDEAHLLFDGATDAFVDQVTQTVRLIRSKGVGVFFIAQTPKDLPADVLGQLGNRVQHALRAFTPDDAKALKATVGTFPRSADHDLEELLPRLAIGEAVVTVLDERGVPTPVVHARLCAPEASMAPVADVAAQAAASPLGAKYGTRLDARSARELLAGRLAPPPDSVDGSAPSRPARRRGRRPERAPAPSGPEAIGDFLRSREGRALQRKVTRGLLGMLRKRL